MILLHKSCVISHKKKTLRWNLQKRVVNEDWSSLVGCEVNGHLMILKMFNKYLNSFRQNFKILQNYWKNKSTIFNL